VARLTVLIIEHDMSVIMDISHRITVLNFGRVIADGNAASVSAAPAVIDAYLGVADS
jgi:branched-chain amino acid transport system ATP-binding protein